MHTFTELVERGITQIPVSNSRQFIGRMGENGVPTSACTIGSALFARYPKRLQAGESVLELMDALDDEMREHHGRGLYGPVRNPVTKRYDTLSSTIMDLHEKQFWSRARIVSWLKTEGY